MTLEEAKTLAEQGNVDAMMALADFYSKKEDDEDAINVAFQYYEQAAEAGEPNAILKMAQTSRMTAGIGFSMMESMGRTDSMIEDIEKAYHWAVLLEQSIRSLNISNTETVEFVRENLIIAISRLATVYYLDKKYDEMASVTKGVDHPYAQAMYGLALYELAETDGEVEKTFQYLKNIENDSCWKEDYQSTKYAQVLPGMAAMYLSVIYRVLRHDVDSSYAALMKIVNYSKNDSLIENAIEGFFFGFISHPAADKSDSSSSKDCGCLARASSIAIRICSRCDIAGALPSQTL